MRGKTVHIANYYDEDGRTRVGQKLRDADKNFAVIGKISNSLFGRHCCPAGGKLLVITEGEIDALSYAEARESWPAVSIPTGAKGAAKAISANLDYIETFDKVVLFFDNDEEGEAALAACQGLISPGKLYKHALPDNYKDLNEALEAGDIKAIMHGVYQASEVRPDGLVAIEDLVDQIDQEVEYGLPWFLDELTKLTYGRRWGDIYCFGAGTGVGKTDFLTEQIAFDTTTLNQKVGVLMLEQKPVETSKRIAGKIANRRFHVPDAGWTREELREALQKLTGKVVLYDSFGETDWAQIKMRIRHMALGSGIRIFYLDHLTAMADTADERGSLEQIMKEMAGLAQELQIIIHLVSHLATPDGTPHEEGGRVMIRHFKGARAIGFWSYFMFGLERDQQADDPLEALKTTFRVLKDRYTGQATGKCIDLGYIHETGRIVPYSMMDLTKFDQPADTSMEF